VETRVGKVLSPYAATKMTNELYAEGYAKNYDMSLYGFRYFNVFGPKQDPDGPYAAVIPLFIKSALTNTSPTINGDGSITRDFTPVSNVLQINTSGLFQSLEEGNHYEFNVACGHTTDLNTIWNMIKSITKSESDPIYGPNRNGDIFFSLANIEYAKQCLSYVPNSNIEAAMANTITFYKIL
jgi:UDP-N-acetylglucosamine 4-epimerase